MFKRLRWQLAAWFACLALVLCLGLSVLSAVLVRSSLNDALQEELLTVVTSVENGMADGHLDLDHWIQTNSHNRFAVQPTVQLFDPEGRLVCEFGPRRGRRLLRKTNLTGETTVRDLSVFACVRTLSRAERLIGYLQVQLPTKPRDLALHRLVVAMAELVPLLILGLTLIGYHVAGKAVRPIETGYQSLRRFMADAGHELNTPLAVIEANAEAIQASPSDQRTGARASTVIRTAQRMAGILKEMFYLLRTEASAALAQKNTVALAELVGNMCGDFAELFEAKQIILRCEELEPVSVLGDAEALKKLLSNLLQNALRYTEGGGTVTVTLARQNKLALLAVSDTGIGIPAQSLPRICERFYRVDASRSSEGVGLGMSIVAAIVDSHGGRIEVQSEVGKGTLISVSLPASK